MDLSKISWKIEEPHFLRLAITVVSIFSFSFLPVFFKSGGMPLYAVLLVFALLALFTSIIAFLVGKVHSKKFLAGSFILQAVLLVAMAVAGTSGIYIAAALFIALTSLIDILFWLPLNMKFFERSRLKTNSKDSFAYAAIGNVPSILLLPIAALAIGDFGYPAAFIFSALLCAVITMSIARKLQEKEYGVDIGRSLTRLKGLKTILLFEGAIDQFFAVVIPVFMLLYVETELAFGGALGYLALVSLIAAYFMARHSDKKQKRIVYLAPLLLAMAVNVLAMGLAGSFVIWIVLITLFSALYTVSYSMRLALIMDRKKTDMGFWTAREAIMNAGRFVTLSMAAILLYFSLYWAIFAMYAAVLVAYPFVAKKKQAQIGLF